MSKPKPKHVYMYVIRQTKHANIKPSVFVRVHKKRSETINHGVKPAWGTERRWPPRATSATVKLKIKWESWLHRSSLESARL